MCFSIQINARKSSLINEFKITSDDHLDDEIKVRAFPHQAFPVIIQEDNTNKIKVMNYSLIPSWSKVSKPKFATYNARVETIDEKPTWIKPLETSRCLVPITSFFESCYEGTHGGNIVEFIGHEILTLAGVFNSWINKETGEVIDSFAVVTKEPYPFVKMVGHDRSPIYLDEKYHKGWLDKDLNKISEVKSFLENLTNEPSLTVRIERALIKQKK